MSTLENIKKNLVRGTQYLRTTVGGAHRTVDVEYGRWRAETERVEIANENLAKDFQAMIENLHTITKTMRNLSREFNIIYENDLSDKYTSDNGEVRRCKPMVRPIELDQFRNLSMELESEVFAPLQNEILDKINVPTKEFLKKFNFFPEMHKKRDNLILDMDYYKDQLKQYEEMASKTTPPHKLYQKREMVKNLEDKYQFMTENNKQAMKDVLIVREKTFDPVFDHFIQSLKIFGQEYDRVGSHYRFFNESVDFDAIVKQSSTVKEQQRVKPVALNRTSGWYYLIKNSDDQHGPISFQELQNLYLFEKTVTDTSFVFCESVTGNDWKKLNEIPGLREALRKV